MVHLVITSYVRWNKLEKRKKEKEIEDEDTNFEFYRLEIVAL